MQCSAYCLVLAAMDEEEGGGWEFVPDPIFLQLTGFLSVQDVLNMSGTCKSWYQMAQDDYLWKRLFRRDFKVSSNIGLKPGTILNKQIFYRLSLTLDLGVSELQVNSD